MAPKLYTTDLSPPCRGVLLAAKALGVELDIKETDIVVKKEQFDPNFLKINPTGTVPLLDDDGTIIVDSHAINMYLAEKYGKDDSLYPKDLKRKSLVHQRLHFDTGSVFSLLLQIVKPMRLQGVKTIPDEKKKAVHDMYKLLETYLTGQKWITGDDVTIADLNLISSVSSLDALIPVEESEYPSVSAWIKRCQALPYYQENQRGLDDFKAFVTKLMS